MPNHPNNTDTTPLFSRPCHNWASTLDFHLTTAILEPLWLITVCPVFDQIIMNLCFGVQPKEVRQGKLTISFNVQQPTTFWYLSEILPPLSWEAEGKTRMPFHYLGLSSKQHYEKGIATLILQMRSLRTGAMKRNDNSGNYLRNCWIPDLVMTKIKSFPVTLWVTSLASYMNSLPQFSHI